LLGGMLDIAVNQDSPARDQTISDGTAAVSTLAGKVQKRCRGESTHRGISGSERDR